MKELVAAATAFHHHPFKNIREAAAWIEGVSAQLENLPDDGSWCDIVVQKAIGASPPFSLCLSLSI